MSVNCYLKICIDISKHSKVIASDLFIRQIVKYNLICTNMVYQDPCFAVRINLNTTPASRLPRYSALRFNRKMGEGEAEGWRIQNAFVFASP